MQRNDLSNDLRRPGSYRFGTFEVDLAAGELRRDGRRVAIQEKPLQALAALLERPGEIVSRDEIQARLWPPGTHLEVDNSLNAAVNRLREALGDNATSPRFVATVPRRGYRFVAPVEAIGGRAKAVPQRRQAPVADAGLLVVIVITIVVIAALLATLIAGRGSEPRQAAEPARRATADVMAFEAYLRGRHHWNRRDEGGLRRSRAYFEQALHRDPDFAGAWVGLADSWALLGTYDFERPRVAFPEAERAVTRALALDPDLADVHVTRAFILHAYTWDFEAAERAYRRALELDPELVHAHLAFAGMLTAQGRHDEAIARVETARRLDPLSLPVLTQLGWRHVMARRFDEAVALFEDAIGLDPNFLDAHDNLAWARYLIGQTDAAADAWGEALRLAGRPPEEILHSRREIDRLGLAEVWSRAADGMVRDAQKRYVSPYDIALELIVGERPDEAYAWLDRSIDEREIDVTVLAIDPRLDPLRDDPRFAALESRFEARELP